MTVLIALLHVCLFVCEGVSCKNLRKNAYTLPDTFVRFHLMNGRGRSKQPHHGQKQSSGVHYASINPSWPQEVSGCGFDMTL